MEISVNQLVSETKKAICGKGYDFGIALDIAKAVELIACHDLDMSASLADFLEQDDSPHDALSITSHLQIDVRGCSGLLSVIGAMDIFLSQDYEKLCFENLQHPLLSYGLIAMRQSPYFGGFALATGEGILEGLAQGASLPSAPVTVIKCAYQPVTRMSWPARIRLEDNVYELLKAFAHKTYVPSSQASRAAGAGAGLTDND